MSNAKSLPLAIAAWRARLGEQGVSEGDFARDRYGISTSGVERTISGALRPLSVDDVVAAVRIAHEFAIPLYPISTGNNWGYGSAIPAADGCVILDLSGLDRIVEMDAELGLVTLEPGVTQQKLSEYLESRRLPFLVPVTGAGPSCSLVGNALERGYGITPYADHFGAVTALEAVLPDGRLYRSALRELGGTTVDRAYKWGIGPYLDGLFAQSGLGIVTQMSIALAPRPEFIQVFLFAVEHDAGLEAAVTGVRRVLRTVGGVTGSINLMNARRMLAMTAPYPSERGNDCGVLTDAVVAKLAGNHGIAAWTGFGAIYGEYGVVRAVRSAIRRILQPAVRTLRFIFPDRITAVTRWCDRIPALHASRLSRRARTLAAALQLIAGKPSSVALPLAYWRSGVPPGSGELNPAADGCGLIWYSPLVPMVPASARRYVAMVGDVCARHAIEPLITLTSLSDRCFDSSVPLLFDRRDAAATARAHACYWALLEAGKNEGFLPYRLGIQSMDWIARSGLPYWDMTAAIKSAIDPRGIIAPGRYGTTPRAAAGSPSDE
jgi:4-cresol dehydrogenase (hydroxylating) flavoprotein subunit